MILKLGDTVQVVGHKFPELHPKNTLQKVVMKTPEELREIHHRCKKNGDSDMSFYKNSSFKYELKGVNCIGRTGKIIEVRTAPETEYEIVTGEIARYVIRFTTSLASWGGKIMTFYPEEVQKIKRITYR